MADQAGSYPGFYSMKQLGVLFSTPPGWDASPFQGLFAGTHWYIWVERGTVRVKSLPKNTMQSLWPGKLKKNNAKFLQVRENSGNFIFKVTCNNRCSKLWIEWPCSQTSQGTLLSRCLAHMGYIQYGNDYWQMLHWWFNQRIKFSI